MFLSYPFSLFWRCNLTRIFFFRFYTLKFYVQHDRFLIFARECVARFEGFQTPFLTQPSLYNLDTISLISSNFFWPLGLFNENGSPSQTLEVDDRAFRLIVNHKSCRKSSVLLDFEKIFHGVKKPRPLFTKYVLSHIFFHFCSNLQK